MVAAVAIEDVQRLNRVEIVLLRVGGEDLRDAGIESAAEDCGEPRLLKPFAVRPLPGVLEVRLLRRLVVRRVEVADARLEARVHDREVLVRQRDVHDKIRLEALDHLHEPRRIHRIDLRGRDLRARLALPVPRTTLDVLLDRLAPRLGAGRDQERPEGLRILAHLRGGNPGDSAGPDQHDFLTHFTPLCWSKTEGTRGGTCRRGPSIGPSNQALG